MIVSQRPMVNPQIAAEIEVITEVGMPEELSRGAADSIGIMTYEGIQSLSMLKNLASGPSK